MFDRRMVLAGLVSPVFAPPATGGPTVRLLAGTYEREGGHGLARIALDLAADRAVVTPGPAVSDASYGVFSPRFERRYLVQERHDGAMVGLSADGALQGPVATGGAAPCFMALDARQSCLAVAHYDSGSVGLIRLDPADGRPLGPAQVVVHHGSGPVRERQAGPHAHWVGFSPDQRWLHAVDLGADAIFAHPFDPQRGVIGEGQIAYAAPAGSGPRHLVRHPTQPRAYLVSELANSLTVLDVRADGRFAAVQRLSTLPAGFVAHNQAAHIAIDAGARRLYVSNRGANTLAVFALDARGTPSLLQQVPSGGDWPRFFLLLEPENRLLVANERSGELAIFHRAADGRLADSGQRIAAPGVVFLMR